MLSCVYDLQRNPPTFDCVTAALRFEAERLRLGEEELAVEILPGPMGGFRQDSCWPKGIEARRELLKQIVIPVFSMLPSCKRVTVRHGRTANGFGRGEYVIPFDHFIKLIGRVRPLRVPEAEWTPKKLITMTLRESEHHPKRNSKVEEWRKAAIELFKRGFNVIAVRDHIKAEEPFGGAPICPMASRDLYSRAALYAGAVCNLFVNNGPAWFCAALDAPTTVIRPGTEGISPLYSERNLHRLGVPRGGQIPGTPDHIRLVWKDDTADNIVEAALCSISQ